MPITSSRSAKMICNAFFLHKNLWRSFRDENYGMAFDDSKDTGNKSDKDDNQHDDKNDLS